MANPLAVALRGLIVAAALVLGSLPLFFGLAVVMPVLGRDVALLPKAIERDPVREVPIEGPCTRTSHGTPRAAARLDFPGCGSFTFDKERADRSQHVEWRTEIGRNRKRTNI